MTLTISPSQAAFQQIRAALEDESVGRTDEIDALLIALIGRGHIFFLSTPGQGKTYLVNRLLLRIFGAKLFSILMSKYTNDQALIGPLDLLAYKNAGKYEHHYEGFLPDTHIALLDEMWKTSSAAANLLLGLLNERQFKNGQHMIDVPLSTVIALSNELPDSNHDECAAIYDRFDLRLQVADLTEAADLRRLLRLQVDPSPAPLLSWDEVCIAQAEAAALPLSEAAEETIISIAIELRSLGIKPSPRRLVRAEAMGRAAAWLAGDTEVRPEHMEVMRHMLWDTIEQRANVDRVVLKVTSPMQKEVYEIADAVTDLVEQLNSWLLLDEADPKRADLAPPLAKLLKRAAKDAISKEAGLTGRAERSIADSLRRLDKAHAILAKKYMAMEGGLSLSETERRDQ